MGSGGVAACEVLGLRGAAAFGGFLGGLFIGLDGVFHLLEADDADAGAEAAVAAVLLDVAAPGSSAAALPVVAAAAAPTAAAVATAASAPAEAAAALPAAAAAATAAAAAVVVADARVHDRLDVAHRRRRQAHPGGERGVARLGPLRLLGAHRGPLHRLAVVAPLRL